MKKRLFALFLVLVMVVSMIIVPAQAEKTGVAENVTATTEICPCGCGAALDQVKWTPWAVNGVDELSSGHYYLQVSTINSHTINITGDVAICLNGEVLYNDNNGPVFAVKGNGKLTITLLFFAYLWVWAYHCHRHKNNTDCRHRNRQSHCAESIKQLTINRRCNCVGQTAQRANCTKVDTKLCAVKLGKPAFAKTVH